MAIRRVLTKAQFKKLVPKLKGWQQRSIDMAYERLVEKQTLPAIAEKYGVTKQAVGDFERRAYEIFLENADCPPGWEVVTVRLPKDEARKVRELEEKLLAIHFRE